MACHGWIALVLDIGGNRPLSLLRRALTRDGTLVIVGGEGGDRWTGGIHRLLGAFVNRARDLARQAIRARKADEQFSEFTRQVRDRAFVEYKVDEK